MARFLALWVGLIYAFFVAMTVKRVKPPLATGLDGTWLLTVVATEAMAILATHVLGVFSRPDIVVFVGLCLFLLGGALYLILISLIVHRWVFETMRPEQLTPSYWINMGAAAITTLAGARLLSIAGTNPLTAGIAQLIEASTVLFWALATWWVPLLVTLLIWRHMVHGIRPSLPVGILVHGVSARHVHRRYVGFVMPKRRRISVGDTARKHLDRIGVLALRLCRNDAASVAPALPRTEELRAC